MNGCVKLIHDARARESVAGRRLRARVVVNAAVTQRVEDRISRRIAFVAVPPTALDLDVRVVRQHEIQIVSQGQFELPVRRRNRRAGPATSARSSAQACSRHVLKYVWVPKTGASAVGVCFDVTRVFAAGVLGDRGNGREDSENKYAHCHLTRNEWPRWDPVWRPEPPDKFRTTDRCRPTRRTQPRSTPSSRPSASLRPRR